MEFSASRWKGFPMCKSEWRAVGALVGLGLSMAGGCQPGQVVESLPVAVRALMRAAARVMTTTAHRL